MEIRCRQELNQKKLKSFEDRGCREWIFENVEDGYRVSLIVCFSFKNRTKVRHHLRQNDLRPSRAVKVP